MFIQMFILRIPPLWAFSFLPWQRLCLGVGNVIICVTSNPTWCRAWASGAGESICEASATISPYPSRAEPRSAAVSAAAHCPRVALDFLTHGIHSRTATTGPVQVRALTALHCTVHTGQGTRREDTRQILMPWSWPPIVEWPPYTTPSPSTAPHLSHTAPPRRRGGEGKGGGGARLWRKIAD